MKLALVIGSVVATRKVENVRGLKILVVTYLNDELKDTKKTAACIDTVGAGVGDMVLVCSSSSARMTAKTRNVVTDNTIVGIVDSISSNDAVLYRKGNPIRSSSA